MYIGCSYRILTSRNSGLEADPDALKAALCDGEIASSVGSGRLGFKF